MAGWKALKKEERDWVKGLLRTEISRQQYSKAKDQEHKIGVLAIAIDVLDKASPPSDDQ